MSMTTRLRCMIITSITNITSITDMEVMLVASEDSGEVMEAAVMEVADMEVVRLSLPF